MYHMSVLEAAFPEKKKSLIFIYALLGIGDLGDL